MTEASLAETDAARRGNKQPILRRLPETTALLAFLVVEFAFFSIKSPYFLGWDNWLNILTAIAVIGIVAAPGTLLMTAGQFDLSVGSITAFTSVIMANLALSHSLGFSVAVSIAAGIGVGILNGFLVTYVGINPLITTLGTLAAFRGLADVIAKGQSVAVEDFSYLGTARPFLHIPVPVLLLVAVLVATWALMRYTVYGRAMYAIGANPSAARLAGIRVGLCIFFAFVLSGAAC